MKPRRLESFVTHLLVPLLVTVSLAYAAELLRTLERERQRSERLALEALSVIDGQLHLLVADDGRGLPDRVRPGANGLRSMRNRAEALGGELRITGGEGGRGTVVALHAPLGRAA